MIQINKLEEDFDGITVKISPEREKIVVWVEGKPTLFTSSDELVNSRKTSRLKAHILRDVHGNETDDHVSTLWKRRKLYVITDKTSPYYGEVRAY